MLTLSLQFLNILLATLHLPNIQTLSAEIGSSHVKAQEHIPYLKSGGAPKAKAEHNR